MRAKEYLQQAAAAERDIRRLEAVIDHWQTVGSGYAAGLSHMPTGMRSTASRVETAVVGKTDAERGLQDKIEAYRKIVVQAEMLISKLEQTRFRDILTLHYLAGMSLADVGKRVGYEDRNSVYRAHGWALAAFQVILDRKKVDVDG